MLDAPSFIVICVASLWMAISSFIWSNMVFTTLYASCSSISWWHMRRCPHGGHRGIDGYASVDVFGYYGLIINGAVLGIHLVDQVGMGNEYHLYSRRGGNIQDRSCGHASGPEIGIGSCHLSGRRRIRRLRSRSFFYILGQGLSPPPPGSSGR